MKVSVFVGASIDGFIARPDGGLEWLDAAGNEPHGYDEFIATVDAIVMGRATFEIVMGFESWPYRKLRVVVLSSRPVDLRAAVARGGIVDQMNGAPEEILAKLAAQGVQHVYLDGGVTIQRFLRAGRVDRMVISRVPVLIGRGIPLFGSLDRDVLLRHVGTRSFAGGLVQSEYEVVGRANVASAER